MVLKIIFASLFLFSISCKLSTVYAAGKDAFSFLLVTPSPRSAGMGESYVAVAEGPESVFSNPSGLAFDTDSHLYIQSFFPPLIEGIKNSNFIYSKPIIDGSWAVQSGIQHIGGITRTVADPLSADGYREVEDFSVYNFQFAASIGRKISENMAIGVTSRVIRESLEDVTANGYTADFGLLYIDTMYPLKVGFSIMNIGPKVKFKDESYKLPYLMRVGISLYKPKASEIPMIPQKSLITGEIFRPLSGDNTLRMGIELPIKGFFTFRAGYSTVLKKKQLLGSKLMLPNGLTMGIGVQTEGWQIDFATVSMGELGLMHRIALDLKWGFKK